MPVIQSRARLVMSNDRKPVDATGTLIAKGNPVAGAVLKFTAPSVHGPCTSARSSPPAAKMRFTYTVKNAFWTFAAWRLSEDKDDRSNWISAVLPAPIFTLARAPKFVAGV